MVRSNSLFSHRLSFLASAGWFVRRLRRIPHPNPLPEGEGVVPTRVLTGDFLFVLNFCPLSLWERARVRVSAAAEQMRWSFLLMVLFKFLKGTKHPYASYFI